jgi:hypothetical protein
LHLHPLFPGYHKKFGVAAINQAFTLHLALEVLDLEVLGRFWVVTKAVGEPVQEKEYCPWAFYLSLAEGLMACRVGLGAHGESSVVDTEILWLAA